MKTSLNALLLVLFAFASNPSYAQEQCKADSTLKDVKKVVAALEYSQEFCDGLRACNAQNCFNYGSDGASKKSCIDDYMKAACNSVTANIKNTLQSTLANNHAKGCGLTLEEQSMIKYYTASGYECLNANLRKPNEFSPKINYLVKTLNQALAKLPAYKGFVVRGGSLPESVRKEHKDGAIVKYQAFTSTSTNFGFGGSDRFLILSKTGRPVMGYSGYASEKEVLFAANTRFKVLDTFKSNGATYYIMKEVTIEKTTAEEQKEDEEILKQYKAHKDQSNPTDADQWICDTDVAKDVPKKIMQKKFPALKN